MNFENPIFLITISSGTIFILAGFILLKFPPKEINGFYGYRTTNSMKSQERWDYAQTHSGKEMIRSGIILVLTSALGLVDAIRPVAGMITGLCLMIGSVLIVLLRTEKAINLRFGKDRN